MRNILVILALFVCTSICLGDPRQTITIDKDMVSLTDQEKNLQLQALIDKQNQVENNAMVPENNFELEYAKLKNGRWSAEQRKYWGDNPPSKQNLELTRAQYAQGRQQRLEQYERENVELRARLEAMQMYDNIAGNGDPSPGGKHGKVPVDGWKNPNDNLLIINPGAKVSKIFGAYMNDASLVKGITFRSMKNNEVIVNDGEFGCGRTKGDIIGAFADIVFEENVYVDMNVSSNTVRITGGSNINDVYGGYACCKGTVSSNTVIIKDGMIEGQVIGGWVMFGTATLNKVHLTSVTVKRDVYGARTIGDGYASSNTVTIEGGIIGVEWDGGYVYGGYIRQYGTATLNEVNLTSVNVKRDVYGAWIKDNGGYASSNTVTIKSGIIGVGRFGGSVFGGYIVNGGTATLNKVDLTSVTVSNNVYGAYIGKDGLASSNTVTITSGAVKNVYGGYIVGNGTAILNTVNLTSATVTKDVYGGWIGKDGLASSNTVTIKGGKIEGEVYGGWVSTGTVSSNTVTITSGKVDWNVFGGYIKENGTASSNTVHLTSVAVTQDVFGARIANGLASSNTVTINGGTVRGNVFGGYVKGNGKATHNTITITGVTEFSTTTILCGGICANKATADVSTIFKALNDAFIGNTLNIVATKGVEVNGISNFENYNFHLKDIKPGEVILTATSGGCSWDVGKVEYTTACEVDLSRSNIHLRTQVVLNKGEYCTLIKSPQGFKDNIACKKFDFDNGGLVEYSWEIEIADNKQDLIVTLKRKELREEKAKPLLEGNVTGMVCINNGMDCIISKMEETESVLGEGAKLQRKGEIGAFYGLLANKSSYDDTGSHIDMTGMSMMGGIGIRWKGLVTGAFGECGTGNSDIDSGLCPCKKKSEGTSNYVGGGLLGRYNVCEDEFRGTKLYLEAILRAGQVSNTFNSKEAKDGAEKEYKYGDEPTMYGGCALGGGYKHKVGEKIDVDWSLRYMFGYQDGKDIEKPVDADGNRVKLESVTSSRIRVGVRGKYVELEKVKPYIGIWYEHELSGKVKGAIQNGVDNVGDIPATSFEGGTGIGELGVSVKVGKLDVGISGQGYLGVRKGFGGMLKLKYAFGKDAHAKPQPKGK